MILSKKEYALREAKWLKEVPSDWRPFRLKEVAIVSPTFSGERLNPGEICSVIPMESVTERGTFNNYEVEDYELITSGLTNFENGDVIFAKITPCMENGKGAYVEGLKTNYAFGSTEFHVLRPNYQIDGKFLYYYTYDTEYRKYAAENMTGAAGQKRVSTSFIEYTPVFLPTLVEQRLIAMYLDKQCEAIDKVTDIKKKQLTILDELRKSIIHNAVTKGLDDNVELVDSGVEWIGKVPNGWRVKRIKRFAKVKRGASPRPIEDQIYFDDDGEYAWVRIQDVTASERYLENTRQRLSELGSSLSVKQFPGDLFISIAGTVGKPVITKIKCCIHDGFIWFENPIFNKEYLYYIFISEGPYQGLGKLGTQLNLNTDTVGQIFIPAPSLDVQGGIVASLDDKCGKIKELANNIESQITVLESYRKSLIHECVTGKRRITEDDLKELANV